MRVMGLDIGDKRIGIAVSDEMGLTCQPIATLTRQGLQNDLQSLREHIDARQISQIVAGLPRNMNGTYGPQAEKVKEFANALREISKVPVTFWDERLTTLEANRTLIAGNVSRQKRKNVVDKIAAVLILQGYLDHARNIQKK